MSVTDKPSEVLGVPVEQLVVVAIVAVAGLVGLIAVIPTMELSRIERMRANGGYVLIDNRTRYGVVASTSDYSNRRCGEVVVASGNRERSPACGRWSRLRLLARGGETPPMNAAQGAVYEVRWKDGELVVQMQDVH
ncbi:hypothetical protein BH10PSE3_BH10PSE3_38920 [soil metagenome]